MIKVAPGMSEKLLIKFKPVESKDYYHKVSFFCEDGRFDIPIIGLFLQWSHLQMIIFQN
jgi:hypothetical protein